MAETGSPAKQPRIDGGGGAPAPEGGHGGGGRAEWLAASLEVLEQEKKLSKERARLAALRQKLPAYPLSTEYTFLPAFSSPPADAGGAAAEPAAVPFRELFGDRSTLIVQHFMFADSWERPCSLCSAWTDAFDAVLPHLLPRAAMCVVARAGPAKLAAVKAAKGWKNMPLYSSRDSTFNFDFQVSFKPDLPPEERVYNFNRKWTHGSDGPGISVFELRDDGRVYHAYSTFAAGLAEFHPLFALLDITPEGRNEGGSRRNMYWLKHKEDY